MTTTMRPWSGFPAMLRKVNRISEFQSQSAILIKEDHNLYIIGCDHVGRPGGPA